MLSISRKIHLREGENIIKIVRPAGSASFGSYLLGFILLLITSFFTFPLFAKGWWGYGAYGVGMLLGARILFRAWFFRHFTMLIVTDQRLVDIDRAGWLDETISSVSFADIKDISCRRTGVWSAMCNYGTICVETKSQKYVIEVERVAHPQKIVTLLSELEEEYLAARRAGTLQSSYAIFLKIIPKLSKQQLEEAAALIDETYADLEEDEIVEVEP